MRKYSQYKKEVLHKKRFIFLHKQKRDTIFAVAFAKVAQLVEHNLAKVRVAGSSPVFRSKAARMVEW